MLNKIKAVFSVMNKRAAVLALLLVLAISSLNSYVYDNDIQVNIEIDGITAKTLSTGASTVEDILKDGEFTISEGDIIIPAGDIKLMKNSTINVKRMKTVVLYNDDTAYRIETTASTTEELKENVPYAVGEENSVVVMETGKTGALVDGGVYAVKEAYPVNIYADYTTYPIMISEGTVADAIALSGVTVDDNDIVTPPLTSSVYEGVEIKVTRVALTHDTQNITLPHEVEYRINKSLRPGEEVMVTEGSDGEMIIDNIITFHDGAAVSYDSTETIVKPAINTVIECGVWNVRRDDQNAAGPVGTVNGYAYSKVISAKATAYCDKGKTASGISSKVGVVAVDPRVIPLGTRLYIESSDGTWSYGVCLAGDTGGLIKGKRVDLFYDSYDECIQFGRRNCNIYVLCD